MNTVCTFREVRKPAELAALMLLHVKEFEFFAASLHLSRET